MRIATLNLRHNEDRCEERLPLIVEALQAVQADVIGLQEVWLGFRQAHQIAEGLNQRTPEKPYQVLVEPKWGPQPTEGVGFLTRLPVVEHERLELPVIERVALRIVVEIEGQRWHIANTHLHHRPVDDESIRMAQMRALLDWMYDRSPQGWLLTGDMNALPDSATVRAATERLESAFFRVHGQHPVTFPTPLAQAEYGQRAVCIDYIFFDPQTFQISDAAVIAAQGHPHDPTLFPSDHYGLMADVHRLR